MPDNIPPVTVATEETVKMINDLKSQIALVEKTVADAKAKGIQGIVDNSPALIAAATQDIADIQAAIPEIKAGLKTTEFWVPVAAALAGIIYFGVSGKDLPVNLTAGIAAVLGIYIAARTMLKAKQITSVAK